jgi:hypothetical protein
VTKLPKIGKPTTIVQMRIENFNRKSQNFKKPPLNPEITITRSEEVPPETGSNHAVNNAAKLPSIAPEPAAIKTTAK